MFVIAMASSSGSASVPLELDFNGMLFRLHFELDFDGMSF